MAVIENLSSYNIKIDLFIYHEVVLMSLFSYASKWFTCHKLRNVESMSFINNINTAIDTDVVNVDIHNYGT